MYLLVVAYLLLWLIIIIKDTGKDKHKLYPMPKLSNPKVLCPAALAEKLLGMLEL